MAVVLCFFILSYPFLYWLQSSFPSVRVSYMSWQYPHNFRTERSKENRDGKLLSFIAAALGEGAEWGAACSSLRFAGRVNRLPHSPIIHRFSLRPKAYGRDEGVGRGLGVGVALGVDVGVPVGVEVAVEVAVGVALGVPVGVGVTLVVGVAVAVAVAVA